MKDSLKEIILMGIGAISMTGEKASELKNELLERGTTVYEEGSIKNEELKREIKEKVSKCTENEHSEVSDEEIVDIINNLDDDKKQKIIEMLKDSKKEDKKSGIKIESDEDEQ